MTAHFHSVELVVYPLLIVATIAIVLLTVAARSGGSQVPTPTTDQAPQLLRTASDGSWCNTEGGCVDPLRQPVVVARTLPGELAR